MPPRWQGKYLMYILAILKITGIIILILIALALLITCYLIFVPFKYAIVGDFDNKTYKITLNDYLHFYSLNINNLNSKPCFDISVLFHLIKIFPKEKALGTTMQKSEKKNDFSLKKIKKFILFTIDEGNQRFLHYVLNNLTPPLKRLAPRIFKLNCSFSAGSPDITGIITGFFSIIPVFHIEGVVVSPDFNSDNQYVQGNIKTVGGTRLFYFLIALFNIYRHPRAKAFFKKQ